MTIAAATSLPTRAPSINIHTTSNTLASRSSSIIKRSNSTLDQPINTFLADPEHCTICASHLSPFGSDAEAADNILVYCSTCNVPVHPQCYGLPLSIEIPTDDWYCQLCQLDPTQHKVTTCCLCGMRQGAMKLTTDYQWCHVCCSDWVPEVFFRIPDGKQVIDTLQIPSSRYHQQCNLCNTTQGCTVQCSTVGCEQRFHITCGMKDGAGLEYRASNNANVPDQIISTCVAHNRKQRRK